MQDNAQAAETAEGVMRIWLATLPQSPGLAAVEAALEELTEEGFLEGHPLPGGRTIYRRRRPAENND